MDATDEPEAQPRKVGRPPKLAADDTTLKGLTGLGQIQATTKEGAAFFAVSEPTFIKFLNDNPEAREAWEVGRGQGLVSLRRRQFEMAKTNATMAIWLGKQHLGQKDRFEGDLNTAFKVVGVKQYGTPAAPATGGPDKGPDAAE